MVVVTCIATVMAGASVGLMLRTPVFEAKARILISAEKELESPYYKELPSGGTASIVASTQSQIVKSDPVIKRAVSASRLYERPLDYEMNFASPLRKYFITRSVQKTEAALSRFSDEKRAAYRFRMAPLS